jgi:hypothetical protein
MPYVDYEKQKAAMREIMSRRRAKFGIMLTSTAELVLWMENLAKKGDEIQVNLTIVQTSERQFFRLVTLGKIEDMVKRLREKKCQDIVYFHPKKFKLVCTEDPEPKIGREDK